MKPKHRGGYSEEHAELCERTLVTLLRGLGPWKKSVFLAGGLVPRYLIHAAVPEGQPRHVGTSDVDLVLDFQILLETDAYRSLEANLKGLQFERGTNETGGRQHHSWWRAVTPSITVMVDLLCDEESARPGAATALPKEKGVKALHIPGSHLILSDFIEVPLQAELLDDLGMVTETVRVANVVPFLTLKALAFEDRGEEKDAYDIVYTLQYYQRGPEDVAEVFADRLGKWPEEPYLRQAIGILRARFASEEGLRGERKDGPRHYAAFCRDIGQPRLSNDHLREAVAAVEAFLAQVNRLAPEG